MPDYQELPPLLPCPFCGGEARFGRCEAETSEEGAEYIECTQCYASTALVFPLMDEAKTGLKERWNRRAEAGKRSAAPAVNEEAAMLVAALRKAAQQIADADLVGWGNVCTDAADFIERAHPTGDAKDAAWQPIETCPDNTSVLFFVHGRVEVGRMEHDALRMGGHRADHFWGGSWADDEHPPTHWRPLLPAAPIDTAISGEAKNG